MNYEVFVSPNFKKEAKKLLKKYPSLKNELSELFDSLEQNPFQGIELSPNVFKIKMAISSKNKGKSGGARIITFVKILDTSILLLSIYNKGERDSISENEIKILIQEAIDDF